MVSFADHARALFFYREQQQIFLFDSTYIFSILKQIGGASDFYLSILDTVFQNPAYRIAGDRLDRWNLRLVILADLTKDTSGIISYALLLPILFQYLYLMKDSYHYED